jgi:hypothetical protein
LTQTNFWRIYGKRLLIILVVVSLIGAGAYGTTAFEPDIKSHLPDIMPEAASFEILLEEPSANSFLFTAYNENDIEVGYVSVGEGQGYDGPMTVLTAWTLEGTILEIQVPVHYENLPWYNRLDADDFFGRFIGRSYNEPLSLDIDIDAVSGATRSCEGVDTGVRSGRQLLSEYLGNPYPVPEEKVDFGIAEIMLLVGLGTVVIFRTVPPFNRKHSLRYLTLVFGLVVFGFWLSAPLSLVNFIVWPIGFGPIWQQNLFLYILVVGIIGLALVLAKNIWCFWLCPFAAIQEGAHLIGGTVRPITKRQLLLRNSRYFILWAVVFLALLLRKPSVAAFEPWNNIFSLEGTILEWFFVITVIIIAVFIYDFWCHYLCPVGATMDIVLRLRMWLTGSLRKVFAR